MEITINQDIKNPFLGLQPFSKEQSHLYFGRSAHINTVIDKLLSHHFCAILGRSGIGKSSFVYCGIFPALEQRDNFNILAITPGANTPLYKFIDVFFRELSSKEKREIYESFLVNQDVNIFLKGDTEGLIQHVIYIDQFEELFNYIQNEEDQLERVLFIELLVSLHEKHNFFIMLSMRSDFIGQCADYPSLTACINKSQFLIPKMSSEELKEAIISPLALYDIRIEENLVTEIVQELINNEIALPSLQHALMRTFEEWKKEGLTDIPIISKHYYKVGGIKESLSIHANEIYNNLEEENKFICEKIFRCITTINKEGKGIRNPTSVFKISQITGVDDIEKCIFVINEFRKEGRSFLNPNSIIKLNKETIIDITHESIMRSWHLLNAWTEKEVDSIKKYKKLAEDAEEYQKGNRSRLRNPELQIAINWREDQKPTYEWGVRFHETYERTITFLSFSESEEEKEIKRLKKLKNKRTTFSRILIIIFLVLGMCGVLLGTHAYQKSKLADKKRVEAEKSKQEALISQQKSEENRVLAEGEKIKAEIEKKKALLERSRALKSSQIAKREKVKAINAMEKAEISFKEASIQKEKATIAMNNATREKLKAENANKLANRLQNLSTARAMALNSYQIDNNQDRLSIAKQAIYGYLNNAGQGFDSDFYNAFHIALQRIKNENYNMIYKINGMVDKFKNIDNQLYILSPNNHIYQLELQDSLKKTSLKGVVKGFCINSNKDIYYYTYNDNVFFYDKSEDSYTSLDIHSFEKEIIGINELSVNQIIVFYEDGTCKKYSLNEGVWEENNMVDFQNQFKGTLLTSEVDALRRGTFLATKEGNIYLFNTYNEEIQHILSIKNDPIWILKSYSNFLFVGTESGKILKLVYNESEGWQTVFNKQAHTSRLSGIAIHPEDNELIATVGFDGMIKLWETNIEIEEVLAINEPRWVTTIHFDKTGDHFYTGDQNGFVKKWSSSLSIQLKNYEKVIEENMSDDIWDYYVGKEITYDETFKGIDYEDKK